MAKRTCSIEGCDRDHQARGFCRNHYYAWNRDHGRRCIIAGCSTQRFARGWCGKHYRRWRRHGDPLGWGYPPEEERFWSKVDMDGPDGCWVWTANVGGGGDGYGYFTRTGERVGTRAHRWSYERVHGEIPDRDLEGNRLVIDHLCRNTKCVNPDHLELVTHAENLRRGAARRRARRTG